MRPACAKCGRGRDWCRCRYVWEGPNGAPRDRRDYSPNKRMRAPFNARARELLLQLERMAIEPAVALDRWADDGGRAP